ncbi:MAG: hypothetical protein COB67_10325 [SAR324 cluster bacterium]|uniref:ABC transmembrane type-1 domain-containing protein n=1 Tax=SAR324 cluster bacterium TaxID=2024889 RepID=A0A2A4SYD1_9DELT|nr:MAG: hypothetical protein COB67_10325 [SAR324 cluster bacterium]
MGYQMGEFTFILGSDALGRDTTTHLIAGAQTLLYKELEFIEAARGFGYGPCRILFREILPNIIRPLMVYGVMLSGFAIIIEGGLSFLGLSVPAPAPSWGNMIAEGWELLEEAPHITMIPATVLFLTVLSLNLLVENLREIIG